MERILITGASGFIGSHLVERLLAEGYPLLLLAHRHPPSRREGVETVQGDLSDKTTIKKAVSSCDTVFHLAGKVHETDEWEENDETYRTINVLGTRHLLDAAVSNGVRRFVFFSSIKAMGEGTDGCLDETSPSAPSTAYGRSKLEAEEAVFDYGRRFGLHVVCLRLPLVYGVGNKGNLTRMIQAIDRGFFPPLKIGNRRSMVHVSNVVEAALLVARSPQANGKCYIVSDGVAYSTTEIYGMIREALGKNIPRWHVPLPVLKIFGRIGDGIGWIRGRRFLFDSEALQKLTGSAWYSSEKIMKDLGSRPLLTFPQALGDMVGQYRKGVT